MTKLLKKEKLPKQWPYWCRKFGLRPEGTYKFTTIFDEYGNWKRIVNPEKRERKIPSDRKAMWAYSYLIGHGRRWRVNCNGGMDISEKYQTFDRWANSWLASVAMPKTEAEFGQAIQKLTELAHWKENNPNWEENE